MTFSEKLQVIRKSKGITQEEMAERIGVSRQAVTKWESGMAYPDILNLIQISNLFHTTIDYLVKEEECGKRLGSPQVSDIEELMAFRLEAAKNTYSGYGKETDASRLATHDYKWEKGEYLYLDSYVGGEAFSGQEIVYKRGVPLYTMNYCGRTLAEEFSGDFLKEALREADLRLPYRGPEYYAAGEYRYCCKVAGDVTWFQGYEEIYHMDKKVYECYFHGGIIK